MFLDPLLDLFRGKAVTIPPMDGALKPNTLLDEAEPVALPAAPDGVAGDGTSVFYSSGNAVFRLGDAKPVADYADEVTALAVSPSGTLAVGLNSGRIHVGAAAIDGFNCPTALAFDGDTLLVCNGSDAHAPRDWVRDLMHRNAGGSLWRVDPATMKRDCLAAALAFPFGVTVDRQAGRIVFSESWKHRLAAVPRGGGGVQPVLTRLPAYPCRIVPAAGGYLLALFAPLNRLVEFVLQEKAYREQMMREIESRFWIAPTLAPAGSFLEPLQNGGVRSMGVHKPWSPTRSYGLLVKLDADFRPVASYHSRANGRHHGVMAAIEHAGSYIVAAKGGDAILRLAPQGES
jgi:hypothetical protein